MSALETASSASPFDVALVEEKQAEPLFLAAAAPAAGGSGAGASATPKDLPAGAAGSALGTISSRFATLTSRCAIVLMHEEEDVGNKAYVIEAIRLGVADVVRFPLVKQSMRTLWQHAVRRMIHVDAREQRRAARRKGPDANGASRRDCGADGTRRRSDGASADSGDSTASEEGRLNLKRGGSSPDSVLAEEAKKAASDKARASAAGAEASGGGKLKEGGGKKSGGAGGAAAGKPKPQPRSTQQWRAAEQRGRRLAIKPHTAVVGAAGVGSAPMPGAQMHRGGVYYHPGVAAGHAAGAPRSVYAGQTQTMTINGQQTQVWVPMTQPGGGVYGTPPNGHLAGRHDTTGGAHAGSPPRGEDGEGTAAEPLRAHGGAPFYAALPGPGPGPGPGQSAPQMFPVHPGSGGMLLVQQANGQQVWVPAQAPHGSHVPHAGAAPHAGAWREDVGASASEGTVVGPEGAPGAASASPRGDDALRRMERGATAQMIGELADERGVPPLGLGLKRSDSLQQMVERSGLLDGSASAAGAAGARGFDGSKLEGGALDADAFRDADMLEEDALDAILAHARDGSLLSFDGMDEAMLEAAAGPDQGIRRA